MRTISALLAVASLALAKAALRGADGDVFHAWSAQHSKTYAGADEAAHRRAVFEVNVAAIAKHNARYNAGEETFTMGLNEHADLTWEEFRARFVGGWSGQAPKAADTNTDLLKATAETLPASVDWVSAGAVNPTKNQEQCGSCWSFSTTGSVEGATYVATGTLVSLSEQQLVDCSGSYGNQGCNGGLMDNAFQYIIANGGLCSEAAYPYTASDGKCRSNKCTSAASITGYTNVPVDSETALMAALVQQPVSIAIQANQPSFQFYSGGVMTAACGDQLDHGVLAVGYGTQGSQGYWRVQNSWGTSWGIDGGYVLLGRGGSSYGKAGQCGLLTVPSYPTGGALGPKQ